MRQTSKSGSQEYPSLEVIPGGWKWYDCKFQG